MPPTTQKSGLGAKLGNNLATAVNKHKADETELGNVGEVPAGVEGGIAQLTECKFDVIKPGKKYAGQYYLLMRASCVAPKTLNGQVIEGLGTFKIENLCDTPDSSSRKTLDDHVQWILNAFRLLGVNTAEAPNTGDGNAMAVWLEETAERLKNAQPYFKFRTWKGKKKVKGQLGYNEQYDGPNAPEPRTNHDWSEWVNFNETDGAVGATAFSDSTGGDGGGDTASELPLLEVAVQADAHGLDEHINILEAAAEAAGITKDGEGAWPGDTWVDLVGMIEAAGGEGTGPEAAEPEVAKAPAGPKYKKGDTYKYSPLDAQGKPKKNARKQTVIVDVEITAVAKDGKTVTLKNMDDGKTVYDKVPVEQLKPNS